MLTTNVTNNMTSTKLTWNHHSRSFKVIYYRSVRRADERLHITA